MAQRSMHVLIAGGTGLIGSALRASLEAGGHTCTILSRTPRAGYALWNPEAGQIDSNAVATADAVVNLCGRDIGCRWTNTIKNEIRTSRISPTALLAQSIATLQPRPRVLVNASAIGYYGIRPSTEAGETKAQTALTEAAPCGDGFLAGVCHEWEEATAPAAAAGVRTVRLRIGVVITPQGGALKRMLPVFKSGLGGPLGNGKQWMSWIALPDLAGLIRFCLETPSIDGALNAVAPQPVTNADFTAALGQALGRPAVMRVPAAMLKLSFGQMADETLLSSVRASAAKALENNYNFQTPDIASALTQLLAQ